MVARTERIRQIVYQVYCEEEHKSLGVFQSIREAIGVADTHNETCDLIGDPAAFTPGDTDE